MILRYNLQFFAKDGPGGEKTEQPTAKKLNDAREKGSVAKSQDLTAAAGLLVMFIILRVYLGSLGTGLMEQFNKAYVRIGDLDGGSLQFEEFGTVTRRLMQDGLLDIMLLILPFLAAAFVVAFVVDVVQVKWKVSTKSMQPKFDKFNPVNGIKRLFNVKTIVNLIKQIAVVAVCIIVAYNKIRSSFGYIYNVYDMTLLSAIQYMGQLIMDLAITIAVIYLIVGVGDYIFQKWKFKQDMMMTKQEVKDEWKNTEGSPEVKQGQKRRMMEASRRRMMAAVPEADVVITNPTHFAVALKYEANTGRAPVVVAKGEDYVAQKIKEVARENNVEIVENKPLARMIYYNVDLDAEIPPELYQAVAEVLAFVYKVKNKL